MILKHSKCRKNIFTSYQTKNNFISKKYIIRNLTSLNKKKYNFEKHLFIYMNPIGYQVTTLPAHVLELEWQVTQKTAYLHESPQYCWLETAQPVH